MTASGVISISWELKNASICPSRNAFFDVRLDPILYMVADLPRDGPA